MPLIHVHYLKGRMRPRDLTTIGRQRAFNYSVRSQNWLSTEEEECGA